MSESNQPVQTPAIAADNLNYTQDAYRHSRLQYVPTFPNQYGAPIILTSGQTPTVFNLPTDVFNLSESILMYTVNLTAPAGNGNYIWYPTDTYAEISHIQFYGSNNQLLVDLDNANNYFKIVGKHETNMSEFLTNDFQNRLYPSNNLINLVPSLRVQSGVTTPVPAAINYLEPAYWHVGDVDTDVRYEVQLPLRYFKNTLLSMNKNFYFNQIMYMKIFWGPYTKMAFQSTTNANPSAGTPVVYAPAAATVPQISNLQLMLATETLEDERLRLMNQISGPNAPGLSIIIPYAFNYKNNNSGASQSINIQLDIGAGRTLMRIYHSVFNNTEQSNTMYDCSNLISTNPATQNVSEKVNTYWTNLNGKRNQTITIDTTTYSDAAGTIINPNGNTDYMNMKNSLKGSVLQNMNVFKYNWHHLDDFSDFKNEYLFEDGSHLIAGIALGPTPITWTFVGNNMVSAPYNHYTWGIFTKRLTINQTGPIID
ncbi:MAG TPA: hypothetical protein VHD33_04260 [Legionellaceae bacterium]|nr:hypothetical protein [Legionellaceae bacterium]